MTGRVCAVAQDPSEKWAGQESSSRQTGQFRISYLSVHAEGTVEMRSVLREGVQQWATEQIVVLPQDMEESVEMVRLVSHERVQQPTADMPRPQMAEETVKMVGLAPRERVLVSASGRQLNLGGAVDHHSS